MRTLQPLTPLALERMVQTCLAKDPDERWQNAHDIMRELEWIAEVKPPSEEMAKRRTFGGARLAWAVAGLFCVAFLILAVLHFRESPPEQQPISFSFSPWEKAQTASLSVSPNGRYIALVGSWAGRSQLSVRRLDLPTIHTLTGTEGAQYPFWSPDSGFVGFFADGKLKKIAVNGGPTQTLCDAPDGRGGTWNKDGMVVFSPSPTGVLYSVPVTGGVASPVTVKATSAGAEIHRFPHFLPDGRHFLFLVSTAPEGKNGIYLASLDSKEPRRLLADESNVEYVPRSPSGRQGYLFFTREESLFAQPFDARLLQTTGDAFPVAEQVGGIIVANYHSFSVSQNGVLAYVAGSTLWRTSELLWFNRQGKRIGTVGKPGSYNWVSLSPDEKRVAVIQRLSSSSLDIWIHELARDSASRFTFGPRRNYSPIWSPDGSRIAYVSNRESPVVYQKESSGTGKEEMLLQGSSQLWLGAWSRDGRFIVYADNDPKNSSSKLDLWLLPLSGDRKPVPFLQTEFNETQGQFSPDGRWMAYTSDDSGIEQIYIQPFPASGGKRLISSSGGAQPRWRGDGKELFYISPDRQLMTVTIRTGSTVPIARSVFPRHSSRQASAILSSAVSSSTT
jgi:Tol biopolymer transport system component